MRSHRGRANGAARFPAGELRNIATLAALADGDTVSFSRHQDMLGLTPGDSITHLRTLEDAGCIDTEKTGSGPASRTTARLTQRGRTALDAYTAAPRGLIAGLQAVGSSARLAR